MRKQKEGANVSVMESYRESSAHQEPPASSEPSAPYDPSDALADVAALRHAVADRLVTPWWYHPILGLCLAAIVLVNAFDLHNVVKIVVALTAAVSMGVLVGAYQRLTGLWVDTRNLGPTSRRWWLAYVVVIIVVVGVPFLPAFTNQAFPSWLAIAFTAVAFIATVVLGRCIDAALREEIRSGRASLPERK